MNNRLIWTLLGLMTVMMIRANPPKGHGQLDAQLYLGDGDQQPLVVGFGGSEGGNAWASEHWKAVRDDFINAGFAFLAVGYFGMPNTSQQLDRISLDAIHALIVDTAGNAKIDGQKIIVIGGSKGGELVLNLASRYQDIGAVIALVPSHVSFPGLTYEMKHSSWMYLGEEVQFVKATPDIVVPRMTGDIHQVFTVLLEDVGDDHPALIAVERINGPVILISAQEDEVWPSTRMSDLVMERLKKHRFGHDYEHWSLSGDHASVLTQFPRIIEYLRQQFIQ
ncbi:acyl-CoA thioester hydrolase/BAAT C-terminal domain-containing protein [Marinicella sediminis]|uniref:Acyl-CoA thioester hydrolase/BAAT C-terminal domain-containing protein n=1 Tax=Marinicella sediminis TaxID=1792834 RepID=A0ABV7J3M7_9GAMM|nr:acyl-CoA thioester hydrolase/BAAT C-terminal domain-containing protein [Marinicella sediminis]